MREENFKGQPLTSESVMIRNNPPGYDYNQWLCAMVVRRAHLDLQNLKRDSLEWQRAKTWLTNYDSRELGSIWWYCQAIGANLDYERATVSRILNGEKVLINDVVRGKRPKKQRRKHTKKEQKKEVSNAKAI